jgi:hypothetical protein
MLPRLQQLLCSDLLLPDERLLRWLLHRLRCWRCWRRRIQPGR